MKNFYWLVIFLQDSKISHSNRITKSQTPLKSFEIRKKQKPIAEFKKIEKVYPHEKNEDTKRHIKWAEELTEVKIFTKTFTKKCFEEIRKKRLKIHQLFVERAFYQNELLIMKRIILIPLRLLQETMK